MRDEIVRNLPSIHPPHPPVEFLQGAYYMTERTYYGKYENTLLNVRTRRRAAVYIGNIR